MRKNRFHKITLAFWIYHKSGKEKDLDLKKLVLEQFTKVQIGLYAYKAWFDSQNKDYYSYRTERIKFEVCCVWTDEEQEKNAMNPCEP